MVHHVVQVTEALELRAEGWAGSQWAWDSVSEPGSGDLVWSPISTEGLGPQFLYIYNLGSNSLFPRFLHRMALSFTEKGDEEQGWSRGRRRGGWGRPWGEGKSLIYNFSHIFSHLKKSGSWHLFSPCLEHSSPSPSHWLIIHFFPQNWPPPKAYPDHPISK